MNAISKTEFDITPRSHGVYFCKYTSPRTGKAWRNTIFNMQLIDEVYKVDHPTQSAMRRLMYAIKLGKGNEQ